MNDCANMARRYEREIPKGYEARIEGNKVIIELIEPKETEDERIRKEIIEYLTVTREKDLVGHPERRRWITYLEKQKSISDSLKAAGIDVYQDGSIERHTVPYLEKQKEQKPAESISQLTVKGEGVYKICPHCKERMVRDDSKVYTSMPPQYGYNCPKCGTIEFDTVMYDNPEMEEQKPVNECNTHDPTLDEAKKWNEAYEKGYSLGYENGRNEHQPAEWSEEDCKIIESINTVFDMCAEKNIATEETTLYKLRAWLKSLRERINILPRQEWSERDKYILKNIHDFVKENTINPNRENCAKECLYWLDSLLERGNLLPRQEWSEEEVHNETKQECGSIDVPCSIKTSCIETLKNLLSYIKWERKSTREEINTSFIPCLENLLKDAENSNDHAEWSEEDEKMRNKIIGHLSAYIYPNSLYGEDVKECIDWFESLCPQPHWKPSKDQMKILRKYVMGEWRDLTIGQDKILTSLYIDLEKL